MDSVASIEEDCARCYSFSPPCSLLSYPVGPTRVSVSCGQAPHASFATVLILSALPHLWGDLMNRMVRGKTVNQRSGPALTPRQQQILRLITDGYTSREIGKQLKISVQTVEVHRFNLMRRLEVRNVAQLIRQALVLKYLPKSYPQRTMTAAHS